MLKNYLLINTNTKVEFMSTMGSKFDFYNKDICKKEGIEIQDYKHH